MFNREFQIQFWNVNFEDCHSHPYNKSSEYGKTQMRSAYLEQKLL